MIRDAMSKAGIQLLARGVDPYNDIEDVPLQLNRDRYARMTRYFDSIGPSGVLMMRQTAALQKTWSAELIHSQVATAQQPGTDHRRTVREFAPVRGQADRMGKLPRSALEDSGSFADRNHL